MKKVIKVLLIVAGLTLILFAVVDFVRFPECYLTTLKTQLKNDLKKGNKDAIKYYQENYINQGRILFE